MRMPRKSMGSFGEGFIGFAVTTGLTAGFLALKEAEYRHHMSRPGMSDATIPHYKRREAHWRHAKGGNYIGRTTKDRLRNVHIPEGLGRVEGLGLVTGKNVNHPYLFDEIKYNHKPGNYEKLQNEVAGKRPVGPRKQKRIGIKKRDN